MIQKVSGQEPFIQALQKALNYWNKINLEDHNEVFAVEIVLSRSLDFFGYVNEVVSE